MRRAVIALVLSSVIAAAAGAPAAGADTGVPPDDAARGVVHRGLRPSRPTGPCQESLELAHPHNGWHVVHPRA
jgi:hypothetical protein